MSTAAAFKFFLVIYNVFRGRIGRRANTNDWPMQKS